MMPAHHITTVPSFGGLFRDACDVEVLGDEVADFVVFVALLLEVAETGFYFFIEEVAHLFENGDGVRFFLGMLPQTDENVEELIDVGEVEVAGKRQGAAAPVVLPQKRVDPFDGVSAIGAVAQVPEEHFSGKGKLFLQPCGVFEFLGGALGCRQTGP